MPDPDISLDPIVIDMDIDQDVNIDMSLDQMFDIDMGMDSEGSNDYRLLSNKPKIEGVTLVGDKLLTDFGEKTMTNTEIKTIFDKVFRKD